MGLSKTIPAADLYLTRVPWFYLLHCFQKKCDYLLEMKKLRRCDFI